MNMTLSTPNPVSPVDLTEKKLKWHAVQLLSWLWPNAEPELWHLKLACAKTLADLTLRLQPLDNADTPVVNWAQTVAMMLNGTKDIAGDPDPFTIEPGKSPELQAWRLLVMHSLAMLPDEGYLMCNAARIALNMAGLTGAPKARQLAKAADYGADVVHYLNAQGHGNSIAWFRALDVARQNKALLEVIPLKLRVWKQSFDYFAAQFPKNSVMASRLTRQKYALQILMSAAPKMVPRAAADIAGLLAPLQASIPADADRQLRERAAITYHLRKMTPNRFYIASIGDGIVADLFATYARSGAAS